MKKHLLLVLIFGGCVSGNPPANTAKPMLHGGTIMPTGCNYVVTVRDGGSAPQPGMAMLGGDPTPYQLHLGVAGDPARSIVMQWRTKDETTLATTVKYGVGTATDQMAD